MKSTASRSDRALGRIAAAAALLCLAAAAPAHKLTEPLFGLQLPAGTSSIPPVSADLFRLCPDLTNARWDRQAWVFGEATRDGATFTVIAGFFVDRQAKGGPPRTEPDTKGAITVVANGACRLAGPVREVFDYGDDQVPPVVLAALARDAVGRYAAVMGGIDAVRAELKRRNAMPDASKAKILAEAVATSAPR